MKRLLVVRSVAKFVVEQGASAQHGLDAKPLRTLGHPAWVDPASSGFWVGGCDASCEVKSSLMVVLVAEWG